MKIVTIVGARPQFIKASMLSHAIELHKERHAREPRSERIDEVIVHTGQHFDRNMSAIFFQEMHLPEPKYELAVNSMSHGAMTGRMMEKIEGVLISEAPEWVLVYGDTNSTLAGALAAKKLQIRLAHVEAGLRSLNMQMPEEINRIVTDRISDILFCPSITAVRNLEAEGFSDLPCRIVNSGDIMFEASVFFESHARQPESSLGIPSVERGEFILATVHRSENTENMDRLKSIFEALGDIGLRVPIVIPLHPRTRKRLEDAAPEVLQEKSLNFIPPVGYLEMLYLLQRSRLVMTDSGGLQKEAYFFRKPCVTLRDETEWVELVDLGVNIVAGAGRDDIVKYAEDLLEGVFDFSANPYGDGTTSSIILENLQH